MTKLLCPEHGSKPEPGCCAEEPEKKLIENSVWWEFLEEIRKDDPGWTPVTIHINGEWYVDD